MLKGLWRDEVKAVKLAPYIRMYVAYKIVLTLIGQSREDSGKFYAPWHRAEMNRRVALGLIGIDNELVHQWFTEEKSLNLMQELLTGTTGKEIVEKIRTNIRQELIKRYPDNKMVEEAIQKIEKAETFEELMNATVNLINDGKNRIGERVKSAIEKGTWKKGIAAIYRELISQAKTIDGVEVRFVLPERLEKQALTVGGDYGYAETTTEGNKVCKAPPCKRGGLARRRLAIWGK